MGYRAAPAITAALPGGVNMREAQIYIKKQKKIH